MKKKNLVGASLVCLLGFASISWAQGGRIREVNSLLICREGGSLEEVVQNVNDLLGRPYILQRDSFGTTLKITDFVATQPTIEKLDVRRVSACVTIQRR